MKTMRSIFLLLSPFVLSILAACGEQPPVPARATTTTADAKPAKASKAAKDEDKDETKTETPASEAKPAVQSDSAALVPFADIKAMLNEKCSTCHNATALMKKLPKTDYTTYATLKPFGSLLPTVPAFNTLPAASQTAITNWINGGLTLNTYTASVKPIIDANCISCHSATAPSNKAPPKSDLTKDADISKYGSVIPTVPAFKEALTAADQAKYLKWIEQGMKTK